MNRHNTLEQAITTNEILNLNASTGGKIGTSGNICHVNLDWRLNQPLNTKMACALSSHDSCRSMQVACPTPLVLMYYCEQSSLLSFKSKGDYALKVSFPTS